MDAALLHVFGVFNNPYRWQARLKNFQRFEQEMLKSGVKLTTVECQYGGRPWDLPDDPRINRVRVRAKDVLWQKENLGRIAAAHAGAWEYAALIDGDITIVDPAWAAETVQQLQLHRIVQLGSEISYLGPSNQHLGATPSIVSLWNKVRVNAGGTSPARAAKLESIYSARVAAGTVSQGVTDPAVVLARHGYPGGAWAFRREAWDKMGGLLDLCIVGAGDHHMAFAWLDLRDLFAERSLSYSSSYGAAIQRWRKRAQAAVDQDVGLVPCHLLHHWHGRRENRGYISRWKILVDAKFDPDTDIYYDAQGLLQLTGNKPQMRDALRTYFQQRNEDSVDL